MKDFDSVDRTQLTAVTGGGLMGKLAQWGGKAIDWGRNTLNAGIVGANIANPTNVPIKTIPSPPRIERVIPTRPGQTGGAKGAAD